MLLQYGFQLTDYPDFQPETLPPHQLGRIIIDYGNGFVVGTDDGEIRCTPSTRYYQSHSAPPVIGDYVIYRSTNPQEGIIDDLLTRKSAFTRKVAGAKSDIQVQGANFDTIFIVSSLNADLNPRKLERFVTVAWESGANPVLILTKADLMDDAASVAEDYSLLFPGIDVLAVSSQTGEGMDGLSPYLLDGNTVALFGASGVGKSTLINALCNDTVMDAGSIRDSDSRGRHTTTHRQLVKLPNGTWLMDTPGMRELALAGDQEGIDQTFDDIIQLAASCRFSDCLHDSEPGCAVKEAIHSGHLDAKRLTSYNKLKREAAYNERKRAMKERKQR